MGLFLDFVESIVHANAKISNVNSQRNFLYSVKKSKRNHTLSSKDIAEHSSVTATIKFGVLLYIYIMYHDDSKLSFYEKKDIKKLTKNKVGYLSKSDFKDIKHFIKNTPSLGLIIDYAKDNHISFKMVKDLLYQFRLATNHNHRYDQSLSRIEREFIIEKELMN